jgi:hypothetical protein
MAKCVYCGTDTQLYCNGVPVCVQCANDLEAGRKPPSRQEGLTKRETEANGQVVGN